jgi:hypothetical protein
MSPTAGVPFAMTVPDGRFELLIVPPVILLALRFVRF